jgi:bilin biosynthesis PecE protein
VVGIENLCSYRLLLDPWKREKLVWLGQIMNTTVQSAPIQSSEDAIAALYNDDNQIRYYAAWWLGKHKVSSACSHLCAALQDERYRTNIGGYPLRRQAARALGMLGDRAAVPALIAALEGHQDLQLTEAAVQSLAALGDNRAVPALVDLFNRTAPPKPEEALIEALATFQVWSLRSQVEPYLEHTSERVQCAAARYLYLCTHEYCYLERIVGNLNHENPYLRWAAAFDLGAIGHVEAAKAIVEAPISNSLKLLNLKRILTYAIQTADSSIDGKEKSKFLMDSIDRLLLQL